MKKVLALMIAMVFALSIAGVAMASPDLKDAKGKVTAVDMDASTITIDDEITVVLEADDMSKAKKGMRAKVTYHVEDGKNIADKVKLKPPRKAAQGC